MSLVKIESDRAALRARLDAVRADPLASMNVLALVEPGLLEDVADAMPSSLSDLLKDGARYGSLYAGRPEAPASDIGPMVIAVGAKEIEWLWRHAQPRWAVSWFCTFCEAEALADRLARLLDAETADGVGFLLRYYDPRLATPMLEAMGAAALQGVLESGESWDWVDPWQQVCTLTGEALGAVAGVRARPALARPRPEPLVFDEAALDGIMRLCEVGGLAEALASFGGRRLGDWAHPSAHALSHYLLRVAHAHGLEAFDSQLDMALLALDIHPAAHAHPAIAARVAAGESLTAVLEGLDDRTREQIVVELGSDSAQSGYAVPMGYANTALGSRPS